jgi:hypothetical protein
MSLEEKLTIAKKIGDIAQEAIDKLCVRLE